MYLIINGWGKAMIFTAIVDLLLAIVFYLYGPKKEATKWAVLFLMLACLGSLSSVIVELIIPKLQQFGINNSFIHSLFFDLHIGLFFILQACTPYGFLMFAIVYSEITTLRIKNVFAVVLLLPIIVTVLITPMKPDIQMDFMILLIWAVPYYLAACSLLLYAYVKEKDARKKQNKLITVCFFVPPIIVIVIFNHIEKVINQGFDGYGYISVFVGIAFVVFIISAFRYGALGVKIKFEKQLLSQTITGVASGTAMLNHAMKNHITNIDLLTDRLKGISETLAHKQMNEDIELIRIEAQQMMQMVKRVQKQIEDIEIIEDLANLVEMLNLALQTNQYLLESKGVSIVSDYLVNMDIMCDKLHLEEVFNNLIHNAVDAVEREDGMLSIRTYETKSNILIAFSDNGRGMAKEVMDRIFDPFFSTKCRDYNFGLGLSYSYLVVQRHGGKINVVSKPGTGTTLTVHLPKFRKMYAGSH
jgi:two-component system NtrC family sensor kinase